MSFRDALMGDVGCPARSLGDAILDDPGFSQPSQQQPNLYGSGYTVATVKNQNVAITKETPQSSSTWGPNTWRLIGKSTEIGIGPAAAAPGWVWIRLRPGVALFDEQGQPAGKTTDYDDYYTRQRNIGSAIVASSPASPPQKASSPRADNLKLPKGDDSSSSGSGIGLALAGAAGVLLLAKRGGGSRSRRRRRR